MMAVGGEPNSFEPPFNNGGATSSANSGMHSTMYTDAKSHVCMHNPTNTNIEILIKNCTNRNLISSRNK